MPHWVYYWRVWRDSEAQRVLQLSGLAHYQQPADREAPSLAASQGHPDQGHPGRVLSDRVQDLDSRHLVQNLDSRPG